MPNDPGLHGTLSWTYLRNGKKKDGAQQLKQYLASTGDKVSAAGARHVFEQGGYRAVVQWQIRDLEHKSATQDVSPFTLADLYGALGQREKTLALLDEAYRQHSPLLLDIQNDGNFDFLHTDERYRALIKKIGLSPAW